MKNSNTMTIYNDLHACINSDAINGFNRVKNTIPAALRTTTHPLFMDCAALFDDDNVEWKVRVLPCKLSKEHSINVFFITNEKCKYYYSIVYNGDDTAVFDISMWEEAMYRFMVNEFEMEHSVYIDDEAMFNNDVFYNRFSRITGGNLNKLLKKSNPMLYFYFTFMTDGNILITFEK